MKERFLSDSKVECLFSGSSSSFERILTGSEPVKVDLKIDDSIVLAQSVPNGHAYMIYTLHVFSLSLLKNERFYFVKRGKSFN